MESSSSSAKDTCVQVALRIRPQGTREKLEGSRVCTSVLPNNPQVTIGGDRSFTYDYVYDQPTPQHEVYEGCVDRLVEGLFDGFNATVLAYGQTGSGKTHTMGTAFDAAAHLRLQEAGVIPRAIQHTFRKISELKSGALSQGLLEPVFDVSVQFVELYNDDVLDLLSEDRSSSNMIRIHEDARGEIMLHGVAVRPVLDLETTMDVLKNGALNRTVASTNMNEQSSRSHAIFTLHVKQQRVVGGVDENGDPCAPKAGDMEMEVLSAKFHFVDLAGSERLKRTGATGDRAKEGISINVGLLALGNVIAALGGASGKVSHVPYRDSKLTRLLQDSLGGNSRTLMIACVSPSDSDFVETLNTMKYANRAKEIKNKVVANQDKSSKMIGELRGRIASLEAELLEFKQGRRAFDADGVEVANDQYHENVLLTAEVNQLRFRVKALTETNEILRNRNVDLMVSRDSAAMGGGLAIGQQDKENGNGAVNEEENEVDAVQQTFRKYLEELERTKSSLYESQASCDQLRKEVSRWKAQATGSMPLDSAYQPPLMLNNTRLIEMARGEVDRERKLLSSADGQTSDYASLGAVAGDEDVTSNDADELDDDDVDRDDDDEDTDEDRNAAVCNEMQDNLNDVMSAINIKERLIEELEKSEHRLAQVRATYEKKLCELSLRIKATEAERDKFLAEGAARTTGKMSDDQAKRIREEYERKIADMNKEYKKLQVVEREHRRLQEKGEKERQQMKRYEGELKDLKKIKVDLVKKINEEKKRQQQQAQTNARAIAARDKQSRIQANKIRTLEMKDKQREMFLKKTTTEMVQLRQEKVKQQTAARTAHTRPSAQATPRGRAAVKVGTAKVAQEMTFSPKQAKLKWNSIEKKLERSVAKRQVVRHMEDELERLLQDRQKVSSDIASLEKMFAESNEIIDRDGLMEAVDSAKGKLTYLQEQIAESQKAIVDVDGRLGGNEEVDDEPVDALFSGCRTLTEARYLLQHLFDLCLEKATSAAKVDAEIKESAARIQQLEQQSYINEQLLTTVIEDKNLVNDIDGMLSDSLRQKSRSPSLRAGNTSPSLVEEGHQVHTYKVRRRTATPDELLYPQESVEASSVQASPRVGACDDVATDDATDEKRDKRRKTFGQLLTPTLPSTSTSTQQTASMTSTNFARNTRLRSSTGGLPPKRPVAGDVLANGAPRGARGTLTRIVSTPRLAAVIEDSDATTTTTTTRADFDGSSPSTSTSPSSASTVVTATAKRLGAASTMTSKSVFARISPLWDSDSNAALISNRKQSRIVAVKGGPNGRIVTRTHTLEGHAKGVLSVAASGNLLVTGSKDRTAILWDLEARQEIRTLRVHPNNVHLVRFIPKSNYFITVSTYQVRIWDHRSPDCVCIKVLNSSGQTSDENPMPATPRQNTIPFLETMITAADVEPQGRLLFTSFAGDVRIWSLDKWASFGRLTAATHSPKSEVSCLTTNVAPDGTVVAYTGSRDHYVKKYEITSGGGEGVYDASHEYSPPHYDNVTCVLRMQDHLFTASKDLNIMKFSLASNQREHFELRAHQQYIQSLAAFGTSNNKYLVSACREGTMRFWDVNSSTRIRLVEEYQKVHSDSINEMCTTPTMLFTASGDGTVGFWKANDAQ